MHGGEEWEGGYREVCHRACVISGETDYVDCECFVCGHSWRLFSIRSDFT